MKRNKLFLIGMLVMVLVVGMSVVGCASAPLTAFEVAENLEGTAWSYFNMVTRVDYRVMVMNDSASGVLTDYSQGSVVNETAFTYTAEYDAQKRSFAGTITLEDGRVVEFSTRRSFGDWSLTARALENSSFNYRTHEQLERFYEANSITAEIVAKYGNEYRNFFGNSTLWRNGDNIGITFDSDYFSVTRYSDSPLAAVSVTPAVAYRVFSKDGTTMTLVRFNARLRSFPNTNAVGTFNVRASGNTVTISGGLGEGAAFNGTYRKNYHDQ